MSDHVVRELQAEDVEVGMVIWAPDDGDWMRVSRIANVDGWITFYRADRSEASFVGDKIVLVRRD